MRLFICTDHDVMWISGCSLIAAEDEANARILLDSELKDYHLKTHAEQPYTLREVPLDKQHVVHFDSGDY
jgi:hypothetical protein